MMGTEMTGDSVVDVGSGTGLEAGVGVGDGAVANGVSAPPPPRTPVANKTPTRAPTTTTEATSHFQLETIPIDATS